MPRKLRPIDQSADKLRLRGLRLDHHILECAKPSGRKRSSTTSTPYFIKQAVENAKAYGKRHPNSYQPLYRVNVYLK